MKVLIIGLTVLLMTTSATFSAEIGSSKPETRVLFSLPYACKDSKGKDSFCLADKLEADLPVVLLGQNEICAANTAGTFRDEYSSSEFTAAHLSTDKECLSDKSGQERRFNVAVIGVEPEAIKASGLNESKQPLPMAVEYSARKVARDAYHKFAAPDQPHRDVAESRPDVFRAGDAAYLLFKCTDEFLNQDGLPILVLKNNTFRLEGTCAFKQPFFFTVNDKLHISYWATVACCGCGDSNFFVYDLSGGAPKLLHQNSHFSD